MSQNSFVVDRCFSFGRCLLKVSVVVCVCVSLSLFLYSLPPSLFLFPNLVSILLRNVVYSQSYWNFLSQLNQKSILMIVIHSLWLIKNIPAAHARPSILGWCYSQPEAASNNSHGVLSSSLTQRKGYHFESQYLLGKNKPGSEYWQSVT